MGLSWLGGDHLRFSRPMFHCYRKAWEVRFLAGLHKYRGLLRSFTNRDNIPPKIVDHPSGVNIDSARPPKWERCAYRIPGLRRRFSSAPEFYFHINDVAAKPNEASEVERRQNNQFRRAIE